LGFELGDEIGPGLAAVPHMRAAVEEEVGLRVEMARERGEEGGNQKNGVSDFHQ
jgi:hypothetical protein